MVTFMPNRTFRGASKIDWNTGEGATLEQIQTGCLQRIADANEKMTENFVALQNDRDYYKRRVESQDKENTRLGHVIRALRGVITRKKQHASQDRKK